MSDKDKIEQAERAWKLFDPEGYAKAKEAEAKMIEELTAQMPQAHRRCPECRSIMRVEDSYLHTVGLVRCQCGYCDYA